jgi:hypothetical protein
VSAGGPRGAHVRQLPWWKRHPILCGVLICITGIIAIGALSVSSAMYVVWDDLPAYHPASLSSFVPGMLLVTLFYTFPALLQTAASMKFFVATATALILVEAIVVARRTELFSTE